MGTFLQDLRFAWRNLSRTPAFPLAAIATLALGIGATTAIFSTVNAVILRPLPYPNPEDLYSIRTTLTDGRVTSGLLSPVEIIRLNDPALSIARAAGLGPNDVTLLRDDGAPLRTQVYAVSEGFFELFGLPMTLGGFTHEQYTQNPQNTRPGRHHFVSDLAGPLSRRSRRRRQAAAVCRDHDDRRRRRAESVRHAARGELLVQPAAQSARRQPQLRRVHAPEAGHDDRARPQRDGRRDGGPCARFPRRATTRASTWSARWRSSSSATSGRFSSSCCRRRRCCWCSRA